MNQNTHRIGAVVLCSALCLVSFISGCQKETYKSTATDSSHYNGSGMGSSSAGSKAMSSTDISYGPNRMQPKGYERAAPKDAGISPDEDAYRKKMQNPATASNGNAAPGR